MARSVCESKSPQFSLALLAFEAIPASGLFQSKCLAQAVDIEYFADAVKCHKLSNMQVGGVDNVYFAFTAGEVTRRQVALLS